MNQPVRRSDRRGAVLNKRAKPKASASRSKAKATSDKKRFSMGVDWNESVRFFVNAFRVALVGLIVVTVVFGGYKLIPHVNPDIKQIAVTGDLVRLDKSGLVEVVKGNLIGGIVTLDMSYLRSELLAVPWVKQVELVKHFPNTLEVRVYEEQALAQWNELGYISIEGEFIRSSLQEDLQHLPRLSSERNSVNESKVNEGVIKAEDAARVAMSLFHSLNSVVLAEGQRIQTLSQSEAGGWTMTWGNGLNIDLGRSNHLLRTRHAMATWQRLPDEVREKLERIDARYDNGVAIRTGQQSVIDDALSDRNMRKNQITEQPSSMMQTIDPA